MILPISLKQPDIRPESYKFQIMGGSGMGKSSFLSSMGLWLRENKQPDILIVDPNQGCAALPGFIADVADWHDCITLLKELRAQKNLTERFSWIGLDILNVTYDFCYDFMLKKLNLDYPPEDFGKTWSLITKEFMSWVRSMGSLGLSVISTCHVNLQEVTVKSRKFQRAIPAFPGGSSKSTFQKIKEAFDIVGYLTFDLVIPKESEEKDVRKVVAADTVLVDVPKHQQVEATNTRVIHFQPSQYWDAQDTSRQLPAKVTLPADWSQDWSTILQAWKANQTKGEQRCET